MSWDDYARHLGRFIEEPKNRILLKADEQKALGRRALTDYCVFELTSGRLQREFLTLWPLLDHRTERERCLGMFARKAREIREGNPFSVMVTCTATSRIVMENVHALVESEQDRVRLYYLGDYPYLGAESASPLPFDQQRVLIVTDVIASATLVKDLTRYVRERGGTVAAVLCVAIIDPALCAEALANEDHIAVLPEKEIPVGHRQVPVHALTWKPIEFLGQGGVEALATQGYRLRQIKIDARTISPRIQREPNGQPLARFTVDETYPLLERVQALDFDFYKAGNRLFTTGVRIGRLLYEDASSAENITDDPELDLASSETDLSESGKEIWGRISGLFDSQSALLGIGSEPSRRVLVTTYNREDLRFRDFIEDGHAMSAWQTPDTILIPRADSIEMPEAYDWLEQHQAQLVDSDVLLLLASARSSENLWRVASVLASVRVRSISVVCLINRMGPTTLDFVQRVRKLLGDPRPVSGKDDTGAPVADPEVDHEVLFSFHSVLNLPDLAREDLAKMQTAVKTLMDLHCSRSAVEGFRRRSGQTLRYFEPSLTTSREFERGRHHALASPFVHPAEPNGTPIVATSWEAKMSLLVRYLAYSKDHDPLIREIASVTRYEEMVDLLRIFLSELDFLKISGRFGRLRCALIRRLLRSQRERYGLEERAIRDGQELPREQISDLLQLESWLIFALGLFAYTDQRFDYRAFLQRLMALDLPVDTCDDLGCDELQRIVQESVRDPSLALADSRAANLALFYECDGIAWALSVLLHLSTPTPSKINGSPRSTERHRSPGATQTSGKRDPSGYQALVGICERFLNRLHPLSTDDPSRTLLAMQRVPPRDREVARQNLHLLLKELRFGAASGPRRRHETIRHLQAQILSTSLRHHPVQSSLQEAIDEIERRFQRLADTLPNGAHPADNRKIRFQDPSFKNRVQDAMHAAATLTEIAESAADLFSFTPVVPQDAERFMNAPGGSPFARAVTRLTGLLQRARNDKAISLRELQTFRQLHTTLLEDIFGDVSPLQRAARGYISHLGAAVDDAWDRASRLMGERKLFPIDVLAQGKPTAFIDACDDLVLIERVLLREVLTNIFLNSRYNLRAYAGHEEIAAQLADQGALFQLWSDSSPDDEVAEDRESIGHIRIHFRTVGSSFVRPTDWDSTTLAKHHRQLIERGGCLDIAPIPPSGGTSAFGETGTVVTLTLISRNHLRDKLSRSEEWRERLT